MNNEKLQTIYSKLNDTISYLENNDLDNFFNCKNELCNIILSENNQDFNDDINDELIKIVPGNLLSNFKNFIKFLKLLRTIRTIESNDNDYTKYTLDNLIYIKTEIFKNIQ